MLPMNFARNAMMRSFSSSSASNITRVGVVGLGLMGHGIAQTAAEKGFDVVCVENNEAQLDAGLGRILKSMDMLTGKMVKKGKMTEEEGEKKIEDARARITTSTDVSSLADCDIVVEAIIEDLDIKNAFYTELGQVCKPETIFASNTSSFPIENMADASGRGNKMVGLHFFNPVQLMRLCEVVRTPQTDDATFDASMDFAVALGKTAVPCKDTPGFVVNRLLVPMMAQAMCIIDRGDAAPKDIDNAMRLGAGHPMGPIHLADYVGLDTCLAILEGWTEMYPAGSGVGEAAFVIPDCLREMVAAGKMGRKSGEGFYKWEGDKVVA